MHHHAFLKKLLLDKGVTTEEVGLSIRPLWAQLQVWDLLGSKLEPENSMGLGPSWDLHRTRPKPGTFADAGPSHICRNRPEPVTAEEGLKKQIQGSNHRGSRSYSETSAELGIRESPLREQAPSRDFCWRA